MVDDRRTTPRPVDEIDEYFANPPTADYSGPKSLFVAYILLLFGNFLMLHRFYLGRWKSALLILFAVYGLIILGVIVDSGYPLVVNVIPINGGIEPMPIGIILLVLMTLVDMAILPQLVRQYNDDADEERSAFLARHT